LKKNGFFLKFILTYFSKRNCRRYELKRKWG